MPKVLITGGSGLIGKHLTQALMHRGYEVAVLSRSRNARGAVRSFYWDPEKDEIENGAIEFADSIVHLAGANIGNGRWTRKRKQEIIDSRVRSGNLLLKRVIELKKDLGCFVSASAIGYYGTFTSERIFTESDAAANDFLGKTCMQWEAVSGEFQAIGIRTVVLRTGVVLTKQGGALSKMILPVKMGIGSAIGSGRQYMPWIHIEDLCNLYVLALEDSDMSGVYNAVAPDDRTNKEFMRELAGVLNKPFFFPNVPAFVLQLIFGSMADIVLKGSRVSAEKVIVSRFHFRFPELENALTDLVVAEEI